MECRPDQGFGKAMDVDGAVYLVNLGEPMFTSEHLSDDMIKIIKQDVCSDHAIDYCR